MRIADGKWQMGGRVPVVAHRRSFRPWLVTMEAETFFRLLRGDFTEGNGGGSGNCGRHGTDGTHSQSQIADSRGGFQI
jgi:hypothetical protein